MRFEFAQKILFRHCDPAGIVFYPRYFEMINDCIEAFFETVLGLPFEELHRSGAVPTVAIDTVFRAPSRLGDDVVLALACTGVGRTSLALEISASCDGETRFDTRSTLVHVDGAGKPAAWPQAVRDGLASFQKGLR